MQFGKSRSHTKHRFNQSKKKNRKKDNMKMSYTYLTNMFNTTDKTRTTLKQLGNNYFG